MSFNKDQIAKEVQKAFTESAAGAFADIIAEQITRSMQSVLREVEAKVKLSLVAK